MLVHETNVRPSRVFDKHARIVFRVGANCGDGVGGGRKSRPSAGVLFDAGEATFSLALTRAGEWRGRLKLRRQGGWWRGVAGRGSFAGSRVGVVGLGVVGARNRSRFYAGLLAGRRKRGGESAFAGTSAWVSCGRDCGRRSARGGGRDSG